MEELNKCLNLRRRITQIEEKIEDIECRIRFPKSQTISDMPKGVSSGNPIENYMVQKEKYQSKKLLLETELQIRWSDVRSRLIECHATKEELHLMYLRFNTGYSWKKCAAIMKSIDGDKWNENRVYRVYRKIVKMIQIR